MSKRIKRKYTTRDINMLTAARLVIRALQDNLDELGKIHQGWTPEFCDQLLLDIEKAEHDILGSDKKLMLRETTIELYAVQNKALKDLSIFKAQAILYMKSQSSSILNSTGYKKNYTSARRKDQESLLQMLISFKKAMQTNLKEEVLKNGFHPDLVERIINYTDRFKELCTQQEILKLQAPLTTQKHIQILNNIYQEIIGICRLASIYYDNPINKSQFNFSKIIRKMDSQNKPDKDRSPVPQEKNEIQ